MEPKQRKAACLGVTICVLAVLAVTMLIKTQNGFWGDVQSPYSPVVGHKVPRSMHHEKVHIARPKCPKYQDMDGKCLDNCNAPNTAVGKVFGATEERNVLDILTKHDVYNVCYCRGRSCFPVKKPEPQLLDPSTIYPSNRNSTNGNVGTTPTFSGNVTTEAGTNYGTRSSVTATQAVSLASKGATQAVSLASKGNTENLMTNEGLKRTATMATNGKTEKEVIVTGGIGWSPMESVTLKKS